MKNIATKENLELMAELASVNWTESVECPEVLSGTGYSIALRLNSGALWNPLDSDADAFGLMVHGALNPFFREDADGVPVVVVSDRWNWFKVEKCLAPDFKKLTRLALCELAMKKALRNRKITESK